MSYLIDQYEIDVELADYINLHALIIDIQANPIAIFNDSLSLLYANTALNKLLCSNDSVATIDEFNVLFRGIKQLVEKSIEENKANTLNKNIKDKETQQLIPYKLKIIPFTRNKECLGVYIIVEMDVQRLVNYFYEEKAGFSKRIAELAEKDKITIKLVNTLFDKSPVGMMILDKNQRIVQMNSSGVGIFEVTGKNTVGLSITRFIPDYDDCACKLTNTPQEVIVKTWDEKEKVLLHCSVESIDEEGQVFSVDTFMDVSDIEKARKSAEKSNQSKSEFLANMSHELRTPLHTIMGFSDCGRTMGKELDHIKADDYFNKIYYAGQVLLALVDDLLDVANLETGKVIFNYEKVKLDELVKDVIGEFKNNASDKKVTIKLDVINEIDFMEMDAVRIEQVVRNLLSNAVKYTRPETKIEVSVEKMKDYLQLRIKDNGPGIPDDELENIFDKFIQSTRTKTGAGGTGLGLSICSEILHQHNGFIWAENNPAGGAIFSVNLYF